MADEPNKREAQDRARINVNEDDEVRYWIHELGVSENQLRKLVAKHGPVAGIIKEAVRSLQWSGTRISRAYNSEDTRAIW